MDSFVDTLLLCCKHFVAQCCKHCCVEDAVFVLQVLLCFCHCCIITKSGGGGPSERAGVSHVVDTRSFHEYSHTDLGLFPCNENSISDNREQGGNRESPPQKKINSGL